MEEIGGVVIMENEHGLSKTYFKNFFGFIAIFIGATLLFALYPSIYDESPRNFDLLGGYFVASFITVLALGHMIAMKFVEGEKRDRKAEELGLTYKDFRKKHKDVLDI